MEIKNFKSNISLVIDLQDNFKDIDLLLKNINSQTIKYMQLIILCGEDEIEKYKKYFQANITREDIYAVYINKENILLLKDIINHISSEFVLFINNYITFENTYFHNCRSKLIEEDYNIICSIILSDFSDYDEYYIEYNSYKNLFYKNSSFFELSGLIIKKDIIKQIYEMNTDFLLDEISMYILNNLDNYLVYYNDAVIGYKKQKIESYSVYDNRLQPLKSTGNIKKILFISDQINEDIYYIYLHSLNSKNIVIKMIDKKFYNFYELVDIDLVILDDVNNESTKWLYALKQLNIPYIFFIHFRNIEYINDFKLNEIKIICPVELNSKCIDNSIYKIKPMLTSVLSKEKHYTNIVNIFIPMKVVNYNDVKKITDVLDKISETYNIRVYSYFYIYSEEENVNKEYYQLNKYTNLLNERIILQELSIDFVMFMGENNSLEYYKSMFTAKELNAYFIDMDKDLALFNRIMSGENVDKYMVKDSIESVEENYNIITALIEKVKNSKNRQIKHSSIGNLISKAIHIENINYIKSSMNQTKIQYTKYMNKISFNYKVNKPIEYIEVKAKKDEQVNDLVGNIQIYKDNYLLRDVTTSIHFNEDNMLFSFKKLNIVNPTELKYIIKILNVRPCVKVLKSAKEKYVINSGIFTK